MRRIVIVSWGTFSIKCINENGGMVEAGSFNQGMVFLCFFYVVPSNLYALNGAFIS